MSKININCDVGEGIGNETKIMPYIQSCNIACGGHTGTDTSMREIVLLASRYGVNIGAHPSYPDKENFGRKQLRMDSNDLVTSLTSQLRALEEILKEFRIELHHIKAHGALYNDLVVNKDLCSTYLKAMEPYKESVKLFVPYQSDISKIASREGYHIVYEGFADRNYNEDLTLMSRMEDQSVITNKLEVLNHVKEMVYFRSVTTPKGIKVHIEADTFCIHSDTVNAVKIIKYLHDNLN